MTVRNRDGVEGVLLWEGMDHLANERRRIENHMGHCRSIDRKNLGKRERVPKLISLAEKCTVPHARVSLVRGDRESGARKTKEKRRDHEVEGK